jgi:hypothetical protein
VEELKHTLNELVMERDVALQEKRQEDKHESEQRDVRFRVTQAFLNLWGYNQPDADQWTQILEEEFTLSTPAINSDYTPEEHTATGVDEVMASSEQFSHFLQSIGNANGIVVSMPCYTERGDFLMDGNCAVLEWTSMTQGGHHKRCQSRTEGPRNHQGPL